MKDIKHIRRDFHSAAWVMPQGSDFGVPWGVWGVKKLFFFEFQPDLVCELLTWMAHAPAPFLAHLSRRLRGELLVYQWLWRPSSVRRPSVVRPSSVRRPSVRQHFQTSSPLKPLSQLNSNFIWRLLRVGEWKFVQMVLVVWPRWPPCPYMVKTL